MLHFAKSPGPVKSCGGQVRIVVHAALGLDWFQIAALVAKSPGQGAALVAKGFGQSLEAKSGKPQARKLHAADARSFLTR